MARAAWGAIGATEATEASPAGRAEGRQVEALEGAAGGVVVKGAGGVRAEDEGAMVRRVGKAEKGCPGEDNQAGWGRSVRSMGRLVGLVRRGAHKLVRGDSQDQQGSLGQRGSRDQRGIQEAMEGLELMADRGEATAGRSA